MAISASLVLSIEPDGLPNLEHAAPQLVGTSPSNSLFNFLNHIFFEPTSDKRAVVASLAMRARHPLNVTAKRARKENRE